MPSDLFSDDESFQPLAERMRPQNLESFFGQRHILAPGKPLRAMLDSGSPHSIIFWGPPGVGKTTMARLIANYIDANFISISAVLAGVKDIRLAVEQATQSKSSGRKTILFVDEVHRFNKAQQDAFLPHVENGTILFIGATTENPSFELNNALLSRARVYVLNQLSAEDIQDILNRALAQDDLIRASGVQFEEVALQKIAFGADGDARRALNLLDLVIELAGAKASDQLNKELYVNEQMVDELLQGEPSYFDKKGDLFYDQISALHKAVRGSSPDGALYWFCRMIDGGCDPLYIARRVLRMASEDIGNADPRALSICLDAWNVQERLGSPEGELSIAQAIAYLACAPKSNAIYAAFGLASAAVRDNGNLPVPNHIRNAPTDLMKTLGHGEDYRYAHSYDEGFVPGESYLPEKMSEMTFYEPVERGLELKIKEKLNYYRELNQKSDWTRYPK